MNKTILVILFKVVMIFNINSRLLSEEIKEAPKFRWGIGVGYDPQFVSIQKDRPYDW